MTHCTRPLAFVKGSWERLRDIWLIGKNKQVKSHFRASVEISIVFGAFYRRFLKLVQKTVGKDSTVSCNFLLQKLLYKKFGERFEDLR